MLENANKYFNFEKLTAARRRELNQLEDKLGVKFNQLELLNVALTHTSYANEGERNISNNERLEFLGDAVLELASSTYFFKNFPQLSEGELTKTRANLVCQASLAKIANKLGLGKILLLGNGEQTGGGRKRESTLEDAFESILGAIYLDNGWEAARDCACRMIEPELESVKIGKAPEDYKSLLQEQIQKKSCSVPKYIELNATGPDHMKTFEFAVEIDGKIFGKGKGRSKKIAEQMAAHKALKKLGIEIDEV